MVLNFSFRVNLVNLIFKSTYCLLNAKLYFYILSLSMLLILPVFLTHFPWCFWHVVKRANGRVMHNTMLPRRTQDMSIHELSKT